MTNRKKVMKYKGWTITFKSLPFTRKWQREIRRLIRGKDAVSLTALIGGNFRSSTRYFRPTNEEV